MTMKMAAEKFWQFINQPVLVLVVTATTIVIAWQMGLIATHKPSEVHVTMEQMKEMLDPVVHAVLEDRQAIAVRQGQIIENQKYIIQTQQSISDNQREILLIIRDLKEEIRESRGRP